MATAMVTVSEAGRQEEITNTQIMQITLLLLSGFLFSVLFGMVIIPRYLGDLPQETVI